MTYYIKATVRAKDDGPFGNEGSKSVRELTTSIAGCKDADDAKAKFRAYYDYYDVMKFKTVDPVEPKK